MKQRRAVKETLGRLTGTITESAASEAEFRVKLRTVENQRRAFKKTPDTPLGEVLAKKHNAKR